MVIAEVAVAIPALAAIALTFAWLLGAVARTVALGDACARVAREVARGVDPDAAVAQAPSPTVTFTVSRTDAGDVVVHATQPYPAPGLLSGLSLTLTRSVVVAPEQW